MSIGQVGRSCTYIFGSLCNVILQAFEIWSGQRNSNPQHSARQADILPIELWPHKIIKFHLMFLGMFSKMTFATSSSSASCNLLSYIQNSKAIVLANLHLTRDALAVLGTHEGLNFQKNVPLNEPDQ